MQPKRMDQSGTGNAVGGKIPLDCEADREGLATLRRASACRELICRPFSVDCVNSEAMVPKGL